jgi:hypothetical protein
LKIFKKQKKNVFETIIIAAKTISFEKLKKKENFISLT